MGSCVLRETIRKGRPRFAPRVSLSIYLSRRGAEGPRNELAASTPGLLGGGKYTPARIADGEL